MIGTRLNLIIIAGIVIAFMAITALVTLRSEPGAINNPLIMGVFPRRHAAITVDMFTPMAKYLSKHLERRVRLESAPDFATFWQKVRQKRYDIVHYNQYHYIRTHKEQGYEVILKNEESGRSTISAGIIVRKDANIRSVQDLKGKKVLFGGGQKAMQSYIFATYLLRQGGLRDDDYEKRFEQNPPSAIVATYHGLWDAAAAGAGDVALNLPIVTKQIDVGNMRYLTTGKPYAHLPWAVKGELPAALKLRIKHVLLSLNDTDQGREILNKAKLTGLRAATDSEFDPHRQIVKEVTGEIY